MKKQKFTGLNFDSIQVLSQAELGKVRGGYSAADNWNSNSYGGIGGEWYNCVCTDFGGSPNGSGSKSFWGNSCGQILLICQTHCNSASTSQIGTKGYTVTHANGSSC